MSNRLRQMTLIGLMLLVFGGSPARALGIPHWPLELLFGSPLACATRGGQSEADAPVPPPDPGGPTSVHFRNSLALRDRQEQHPPRP